MRIALLEDDKDQAAVVSLWLSEAGHGCHVFNQGAAFLKDIARETYDLLIIDWMLPDTDGITVLEKVRDTQGWEGPVLFLTVRDSEEDIVRALDSGADDYLVKSGKARELVARVNALLRRVQAKAAAGEVIEIGGYTIDSERRELLKGDEPVELTQKEFDLAHLLFSSLGRLLSRGYLLEHVWGLRAEINTRTVDTHVSRLRGKLGIHGEGNWRLTAVYQHGYRLEYLGEETTEQ